MTTSNKNGKYISRVLSSDFISMLSNEAQGVYSPIVEMVRNNKDLHLEFKGNLDLQKSIAQKPKDEAIIVLYKGNRVFTFHKNSKLEMTPEFIREMDAERLPQNLTCKDDVVGFLKGFVPQILFNIANYGKSSMEIEYEQMLIRANNLESRVNSEYVMVYNQGSYVVQEDLDQNTKYKRMRFDVMAIKWPQHSRQRKTTKGRLALIEIKYALNQEIGYAHKQLEEYYKYLTSNYEFLCEETKLILRQKLELGLIDRDQKQVKKLKELEIDTDPTTSEIILYLVDYNPYSKYKDVMLSEAKKLGFSRQIRIADGGLAMWDKKRERWEGI